MDARENNLSESKRILLEQRLKRVRGAVSNKSEALTQRPPGKPTVASLGQQRIWLLHQLDLTSPSCSITNSFHIKGEVDLNCLERSINLVIQRHEVLRSTFSLENEVLIQNIQPTAEIKTEHATADTIDKIKAQFQRLVRIPFILDKGPLVRVLFGQSQGGEAILTLVTHDIIFDKWSLILFWKEVGTFYQAHRANLQPEAEPLTIQYQDFAYKQYTQVKEGYFENQLRYWKEKLRQLPDPLPLPTDRPYPTQLTDAGKLEKWSISEKITQGLRELAKQTDASLFTVLLYGLKVLLHYYTGQEDILVGSPVANRRHKETANLIGFFLNTLCIRSDLSGNPTLMEGLLRTQQATTEATQNQDLPLDWIVDNIELERVAGRHPLFQVMFVYQREDEGTLKLELGSAELEYIFIETQTAKFDFTLFVAESENALETVLEYRTDIFDASTMHRLLCHYEVILAQLVADPQQKLSELNCLTSREHEEILSYGTGEQISFERLPLVPEQVIQQARLSPEAIAIQEKDNAVTYKELQARMEHFAGYMTAQGIQPGDHVGLLMQRSPDAIVALLAIMKMGAAYLPIDPEYPEERKRFIIKDANVSSIATTPDLLHKADALASGVRCITEAQAKESDTSNKSSYAIKPDDKAYIIYTSGSTGKPKGVSIGHDNLRSSTAARLQYYSLKPERFLLIPNLSFDSSVAGIFWTLTTGGTLIIPEQAHLLDPDAMRELIANEKVDSLLCIPSLYQQWLDDEFDRLKSLRAVIVAGERCSPNLVQRHFETLPDCRLFNEYGPAEATVWSTVAECAPTNASRHSIPIGKPIANCNAYVLDSSQRLLPFGFQGELYLGGEGIAQGYLNQPELSKERFITTDSWGRLYRTGDRVQWDASGELHFLGRSDNQVKIRGYRIELGEVKVALLSHSDIEEAIVLVNENTVQLIAFIKFTDAIETPSDEAIFLHLNKRLPEFMIPNQILAIDSWPRTTNGKIDRKALLRKEKLQRSFTSEDEVIEVQTSENENARKLLNIWREVLNNPNIGLRDNFFQMGGDSILAIQTISKARQAGIPLTVNQLFVEPTVAQIVSSPKQPGRIKAEQNEISGSIKLTPIQHWFLEQNPDDPDWWNQSLLLEVNCGCKFGDMENILDYLLRHHDGFRARVSKTSTGWSSFINQANTRLELDHLDLSKVAQEKHETLITKLANTMHHSMRLNSGNLLKAAFIEFGHSQSSQLLLIAHHWAVDAISWGIIQEDLNTLTRQNQQDLTLVLPDKTTSIQAWANSLHTFSQSETIARELSFWEGQPYSECANIPFDFNQRMPNNEASTRVAQLCLSAEETVQLKTKSIELEYSLQKILLTSVAYALAQWTEESAVLVGMEGHGREERIIDAVDLTRTIGWFTSYFPVVLELNPKEDINVAVREISAQLDQIPRKGIGFGTLKYLSDHSEKLKEIPDPQIIFNYLGRRSDHDTDPNILVPIKDRIGTDRNPKSNRAAIFEINALIRGDSLELFWQYSENLHAAKTVEGLIEKVRIGLEAIIDINDDKNDSNNFPLDEDDLNVLFE